MSRPFISRSLISTTTSRATRAAATTALLALTLSAGGAAQELLRYAPQTAETVQDGSSQPVEIDLQLLASDPETFSLTLPDGQQLRLRRDDSEPRAGGDLAWWGSSDDPLARASVTLTLHRDRIVGLVLTSAGSFQISTDASGDQTVAALTDHEPWCPGGVPHPRSLVPPALPGRAKVTSAAGGGDLTFLVLYTEQARDQRGGPDAIEAVIRSSVDYFNRVLRNSDVVGRGRLVHVQEAPSQLFGSSDLNEALAKLRSDPDVAALRRQTGADVVTLYTGQGEAARTCGLAYLMLRGDNARSMAPWAFNAVSATCTVDVLAHEVGHNLGLNHNPEQTGVTPAEAFHAWSFGHRTIGENQFRTVMSYGRQPRIDFYSRADRDWEGQPIGVAGERENALTIRETFPFGVAFTGGGGGPPPPSTPSNLSAEVVSATAIRLFWQDEASDETDYLVEGRVAGETTWSTLLQLPADSAEALVEGLEPATTYELRVRARRGSARSSPSNVVSATTAPAVQAPASLAAYSLSESQIRLEWPPGEGPVVVEMSSPTSDFAEIASSAATSGELVVENLDADTPYTFRLRAEDPGGAVAYGPEASVTTGGRSGPCGDDSGSLCLLDGQFEVRAAWRNQHAGGVAGSGSAVPIDGSNESGLFFFFKPDNIELVVKLLDGRTINDAFWHFYGALSDVEYWITVRDTDSDESRTYHNRPGEICGAADVQAFVEPPDASFRALPRGISLSAAPSPSAPVAGFAGDLPLGGVCVDSATTLCLQNGRFAVEVDWVNQRDGSSGAGGTLPALSTRETGFFWFLQPGNVELAVKLLDGRAINDRFWFFWGGLSDLEYTIRVRDLQGSGEVSYRNEPFDICGGADLDAL